MRRAGGLNEGVPNARGRKSRRLAATAITAGQRSTRAKGTMMNPALPALQRRTGRADPPTTKARLAAPSARPGSLDRVDGGLDGRGYSQSLQTAQGSSRSTGARMAANIG